MEKENPKKQQGNIAKCEENRENRRTELRADSTEMKKVPVMRVEQTANVVRGYAGVVPGSLPGNAMKTPTSQTINPLCHLNRGRCVSRGRGRVVNRYWNGYRFIATPYRALRAAGWVARVGVKGASSGTSMIIEIRVATVTRCLCNNAWSDS